MAIGECMLKKCHFIGIGGIGMSGLAHLLMNDNCSVSGSDIAENDRIRALSSAGASISLKHASGNIPAEASIVYTSMVNDKNPEFQFAKENNLPLLHRSDLLKMLMQSKKPLLVGGSHGKTTTTSLLSWVLEYAGNDPTYAIGGVMLNAATNARKGNGPYFVAEADESDGTFTKYCGFGAIITNISHEHMDFYKEEKHLLNSFKCFMDTVQNKELLFWCREDERLQELNPEGISYGFCDTAQLQGRNFRQEEKGICFDVLFKNESYPNVCLPILGKHNALNALAVFGQCLSLGIPEIKIREAFALFKGVARRMEKKGEAKGVLVIDDYAHHPNEIATTINTLRQSFPWRRIVVLYQPHRYSRTYHCKGTFGPIFASADLTFVTDIYAAMEEPIEGIDAYTVIKEVPENCHYLPKEKILLDLVPQLQPLDILILLGAGDITSFSQPILKLIQEQLPALKLALIFGGKSQEHEISLFSAQSVDHGIDPAVFETVYFAIDQDGKWQSGEVAKKVIKNRSKIVPKANRSDVMTPETLHNLFSCDLAFPVMHGPYGEDGKIQGFLEILGLPHLNCSSKASALCMDKALLKKIAQYHHLPILPFVDFSAHDWHYSKAEIVKKIAQNLKYPLFVKPVHLGSTIGVIKVSEESQLEESIEHSLLFDKHIIVENGVEGREIEFALFGDGAVRVFAPGEIMVSGKVYDFASKYGDFAAVANPSAELPKQAIEMGMELAKQAYKMACCDGFARVDFFYDKHGQYFLNEINPIPGFTTHSMYPKICEENGVKISELINYLASIGFHKQRKMLKRS